ncbi:MAG: DUF962 domain-containing protein [Bacteroidetes bacterium]|nr:DUF962 domain-containing protein [Bacteroidota bacterium]MBS1756194.1 DUF962 domain-containing protein [Bacteroidota bacterium]
MKSLQQWLSEYGESHQNETNKLIHWICVPCILFSVSGLLYAIKLPFYFSGHHLNLGFIVIGLLIVYYFFLSRSLWVGLMIFEIVGLSMCNIIEITRVFPLWIFCLVIFVLAWIGQFIGHKIEGKKPSFFKDLQFLLIGPAWLMNFIYEKLEIKV